MALNKKLLLEVMEEIEKFPETHDQGEWFRPLFTPVPSKGGELCNTSLCFAGHAAVLSGVEHPEPPEYVQSNTWRERMTSAWYVNPETRESILCHGWTDEEAALESGAVTVEKYAKDVLGLTRWQKDVLFYSSGSHARLREIIEGFIADAEREEAEENA